jgi:hypothetical protein
VGHEEISSVLMLTIAAAAAVLGARAITAQDPHYGLAVMKAARPEAMLLALTILSPPGQKILASNGFKPVTSPNP